MPCHHQVNNFYHCPSKQRGAALMVMLVILVMGTAAFMVSSLSRSALQIERDQKTAEALAQARNALIGYATSVNLFNGSSSVRPGDLPCPDTDNDGIAGSASSSPPLKCNLQSQRIGRLPWKTLGIPDLRDGNGERLWYAVSNNFKNNDRIGTLNSDSIGTISIFSPSGVKTNDGNGSSGAIAVVIAPNEVITRQDNVIQDRSAAGINDPINYLDIVTINSVTQDNANFIDSSSSDGFIQGPIKDNSGKVILNDQFIAITKDSLMPAIQKRVANEVRLCLEDFASNNNGRYPWAAPITNLVSPYNDNNDEYFGRIPDDLTNTNNDIDNSPNSGRWGTCNTHTFNTPKTWWTNWKEMVFYGVAKIFSPTDTPAPIFPSTCTTPGNCLSINGSNTPARFVVIVAGEKLSAPDQANRNTSSSNRSNPFYFLEGGNESANQSGSYTFTQGSPAANFNDTLVYK